MSSNMLLHIADRVLNKPLLLHPDKLAIIASVLEGRIGIDVSDLKSIEAESPLMTGPDASRFVGSSVSADGQRFKPYRVDNGVALIPVLGSLVNRGAWVGSKSGMTSYEGLAFQLDAAAKDPEVNSILLDMDSPGGEAVGAFEIADKVAAIAKSKPVTAMINGMAASAAYAIASSATEIVSTPSGISGSIGVVMMHADYSNALHMKGIKPTFIHAGAHKVDGNPYEPLPASVRSDFQAEIDQFYGLFVSGVAKGRKGRMTDKSVRGTEARTYIGQAAVDAGLVDKIGSFESVMADLAKRKGKSATSPKATPASPAGLDMGKPTGPRSAEHRAEIEKAAAADPRLAKVASIICGVPYDQCGQAAALELVEIAKKDWARHDAQAAQQLHPSGLFLPDASLSVSGGPLFSAPVGPSLHQQTEDGRHGWDAIVDRMSAKFRKPN